MAAPALKQQRSRMEPVAQDEMTNFVGRVIACSQLEVLLAEVEIQRPDKVHRRKSPASESGLSEYSLLNSPSEVGSPGRNTRGRAGPSASSAAAPKGPPTPQPVNAPRNDAPRGPPTPQPVNGPRRDAPRGPPPPTGAYAGRQAPASPATSDLFTSDVESFSTIQDQMAMEDDYQLPRNACKPLPKGVPDLATWGRTLLVLPKYASLRWSYRKLLEKAWHDKEILSYLRWIKSTYYQDAEKPVAGKASDLAAFLIATDYPIMERIGCVGATRTLVDD
ncbi:GIP [Symbiodinium sp. CCMP2592]|nr:GIP [Symbiodinium sp. CCMP2592]